MKQPDRELSKSRALDARSRKAIAHGALTNSKRPESFVRGVYPTHIAKGKDCYVWDVDGNRYVDFICGLGTNLVGYAQTSINEAITRELKNGSIFSLGTEREVQYAERIKELFPVEKIRLLKTGSEACSAAIRIARAYTGKELVLSEAYHGWHDEFVFLTPPAVGVPHRTSIASLSDVGTVSLSEVAAVIIEPIVTDYSPDRIKSLKTLSSVCESRGILLIFDETITGLRFPELSVAKHLGITPDLMILGKALGGGLPMAVVGGKAKYMDCDYFVSSTFAGDTTAMAASFELLRQIQGDCRVSLMWDQASKFVEEFNAIDPDFIKIEGYPLRGVFKGTEIGNALFFQQACDAGLLFGPTFFWNFHHTKEAANVLSLCRGIITKIRNNEVQLRGEMPRKAYAQKARENATARATFTNEGNPGRNFH